MSILFEPYKIGTMEICNRFMRSATTSYWSDENGIVRPEIIRLYRLAPSQEISAMLKGRRYTHYRLVVGEDGTWHSLDSGR